MMNLALNISESSGKTTKRNFRTKEAKTDVCVTPEPFGGKKLQDRINGTNMNRYIQINCTFVLRCM